MKGIMSDNEDVFAESAYGPQLILTRKNSIDNLHISDKRHPKGRFGWVKRLMQGQNRQIVPHSLHNEHDTTYRTSSRDPPRVRNPVLDADQFSGRRRSNSTPHGSFTGAFNYPSQQIYPNQFQNHQNEQDEDQDELQSQRAIYSLDQDALQHADLSPNQQHDPGHNSNHADDTNDDNNEECNETHVYFTPATTSYPSRNGGTTSVRIIESEGDVRKSSLRSGGPALSDNDDGNESEDDLSARGACRSSSILSDQVTTHSDNISTTPLKSIVSVPSTKAPSILSNEHNQDNHSYVASTAETSIAPSGHTNGYNYQLYPGNASLQSTQATTQIGTNGDRSDRADRGDRTDRDSNRERDRDSGRERDSESIITLASSSRRTRRRSLDTNCSTTGIPPASIMERLSVHPSAPNNSSCAVSVHNSNERNGEVVSDAND